MESLLTSSTFTFLVGPDRTAMMVHRDLAKGLSGPLHALINNGQMSESVSGTATLEDIEVPVFAAFCEFAYRGYYRPLPAKRYDSEPQEGDRGGKKRKHGEQHAVPSPKTPLRPSSETSTPKTLSKPLSDNPKKLWLRFLRLTFEAGPYKVQSHSRDRENMFFDLKVYVFATRYLIKPLRDQSLYHIHASLQKLEFPMAEDPLTDFSLFVEQAYMLTERKEVFGPQLRSLVSLYIASKAQTILQQERMITLMDKYGELGSDVACLLAGSLAQY